MKIGFVSDLHHGNHRRHGGPVVGGVNDRARLGVSVFETALRHATLNQCEVLVVNGDVFDSAKPEPQVIALVQQALASVKETGMEVVMLVGNHDQQSAAEGDHALGPLRPLARVVEQPEVLKYQRHGEGVEVVCVPFQSGAAKLWLGGVLDAVAPPRPKNAKLGRVLCVHLGISDDATPPWLRDAHDSIHVDHLTSLAQVHDVDAVFSGNWHDHVLWEGAPLICQVGALCPTGWDNPGLEGYGGLAIYDTEVCTVRMLHLPGPRFVVAKDGVQLESLVRRARAAGHTLFAQVGADPSGVAAYTQQIEALRAEGVLKAGEVVLNTESTRKAAQAAAAAAQSATTLDEAFNAFVSEMPLEGGIDRATVLAQSRSYLAGATGS